MVKQDLIDFLNVPPGKIQIIPSPPPSHFITNKIDSTKKEEVKSKHRLEDFFFFYPAQFWPHKNHINLIRALHRIRTNFGQTINLVLAGSPKNKGGIFENVMAQIEKLKLRNHVKYLGYVPDADMPYLYKLSTALVMPTLFESVSIPIWEAFYLGVPVVSSNVCALPEQIGEAGLLFDPNNVNDMAEKIYKVWTNEELRKDFIKKGHERVKDLTLKNYAEQWEDVIFRASVKFKKKGQKQLC